MGLVRPLAIAHIGDGRTVVERGLAGAVQRPADLVDPYPGVDTRMGGLAALAGMGFGQGGKIRPARRAGFGVHPELFACCVRAAGGPGSV